MSEPKGTVSIRLTVSCPHCGAKMNLAFDSPFHNCEFCNEVFWIVIKPDSWYTSIVYVEAKEDE